MLDMLIASRPEQPRGRALGTGALVGGLHAGLIALAVWATRGDAAPRVAVVEYHLPAVPNTVSGGATSSGGIPLPGPPRISVPPDLPIPVFDGLSSMPEPLVSPPGRAGVAPRGGGGDDGAPLPAWLADERPELLSARPPAYPAGLRELGVTGRVVVRVVVDTLGRAEPGSFTVVSTPHPGLTGPVREAVGRALFRPGRVRGRAVRVLVEIPFEFRIEP